MAMGLWEGIAGSGLRTELRLAAAGCALFFLGWLLERKLARRG